MLSQVPPPRRTRDLGHPGQLREWRSRAQLEFALPYGRSIPTPTRSQGFTLGYFRSSLREDGKLTKKYLKTRSEMGQVMAFGP